MRILMIDTAGPTSGVLLATSEKDEAGRQETQVLGASEIQAREFSAQLIPAIDQLLQAHSLSLTEMDALAVVSGPGSFTGLRVGLSAVKAMAEATAKPVIAISRLAVLASVNEAELKNTEDKPIHAVLDAGRGEFYHGIYRDAGRTRAAESLQTLASLTAALEGTPGLVVASEPVVLSALANFGPLQVPSVSVRDALPLVLTAWNAHCFCDVASLDANYLRRSDAEILWKLAHRAESASQPR